jgi:hypothetical protein
MYKNHLAKSLSFLPRYFILGRLGLERCGKTQASKQTAATDAKRGDKH